MSEKSGANFNLSSSALKKSNGIKPDTTDRLPHGANGVQHLIVMFVLKIIAKRLITLYKYLNIFNQINPKAISDS